MLVVWMFNQKFNRMESNTRSRKSSARKKAPVKEDSDSDYEEQAFDEVKPNKATSNDGWIKKSKP